MHKKNGSGAGFSVLQVLVETCRYCYMVPEGDSCALYNSCLVEELYIQGYRQGYTLALASYPAAGSV